MANNKFNIGDMVFITSTKAVGKVIGIYFDEHRFKLWQDDDKNLTMANIEQEHYNSLTQFKTDTDGVRDTDELEHLTKELFNQADFIPKIYKNIY